MNDQDIIHLLTEIRDNQVREIRLREQFLEQSKDASAKLNRSLIVFLAGIACFIAFGIWRIHWGTRGTEEWQERQEQAEWEESEPI